MKIGDKTYTLDEIRKKMPIYDMFSPTLVLPGSQEEKLDQEPISTTNPNLHLRFDASDQIKRGPSEVFDRRYVFIGLIGTNAYSFVERFTHDEEDTKLSEIP